MKNIFKDKSKEKEKEKETKEFIKKIETKTLDKTIKEQKKFIIIAEKEYGKRRDRSIKNIIGGNLYDILDYGMVVLLFGLFMLGAIPSYFNVNDELINPSNESMSINYTLDLVKDAGYDAIVTLHNIGVNNPNIFFWLFWLVVFMAFIYPFIKIGIDIFRKYSKGGKNRWTLKRF